MKLKLLTILLLCTLGIGCGYGSSYNNMTGTTNSAPAIAQLSPSSVSHGGANFTLTVTGSNFDTTSIVYWGTTPLSSATAYSSSTQVTAAITSAMIANAGTVSVYVHTNAGNSNSMTFTIN
jgi:IPT/TIG domain-containing protein